MLRAAQLYYRMNLTQDQVGERLGVSRFKVGRLLDRALRESAVRIEIVHPAARLVELEDALVERFGLGGAVVVDVASTGSAQDDELLARERVAAAAAAHLASLAPSGAIGVSWGRTMLEVAAHLRPGWTAATEIVQLNGATSRSARPTRAHEIVERFGATSGAAIRLMAAPAIVGTPELRDALERGSFGRRDAGSGARRRDRRSSAWACSGPRASTSRPATWERRRPRRARRRRGGRRHPGPFRARSTVGSRFRRSTGGRSGCPSTTCARRR